MVIFGGSGALEHATLSHFECPKFDVLSDVPVSCVESRCGLFVGLGHE